MEAYQADSSWRGKLRRRAVRFASRSPARAPAMPMVSFAFDDVPASATDTGAAILERHGLKGTFYVAAALAGADAATGPIADVAAFRRLAAAGHEIGCHTYSHLDCGQASVCDAVEDVARNADTLLGWGLPRPSTFAYPFGDVAPATKRALAARFELLSRAAPRPRRRRGRTSTRPRRSVSRVRTAKGPRCAGWTARPRRRAWLILCMHDVAKTPSPWGCTPATLERLASTAVHSGFEVVTVAEGVRRLGVRGLDDGGHG